MTKNTFNPVIANRDSYNQGMLQTLTDKIFFLEHVNADIFIDFGCANGVLLSYIREILPTATLIGYDISEDMIKEAHKRCNFDTSKKSITFTNCWDDVISIINQKKTHNKAIKSCLICSSVIHEVYSYSTDTEIQLFWDRFWCSGFDYIAIRDMYRTPVQDLHQKSHDIIINEFLENIDKSKYFNKFKEFLEVERLTMFRNINDLKHFLLKYFYDENWNREVHENYLPQTIFSDSDFQDLLKLYRYHIVYKHIYCLPFLKKKFNNDFNLHFEGIPTHFKYIFKKV